MNPACDDEERAYQRHEMDVIAAFVQDAFRLPNPEEIVPGCDGCEEKRNKMIITFPMMFQDGWQKRDGNQERRKGSMINRLGSICAAAAKTKLFIRNPA